MGVEPGRAPRPPAATDTSTDLEATSPTRGLHHSEESPISGGSGEEIGTELSRRTDQTHWSVPSDGSPIDIPIRKRREKGGGVLTRSSNKSQTSLLIEYYEGGKESSNSRSRPSVRVKVTPSAARKIKDTNEHLRISEAKASRKPSYTRRISLDQTSPRDKRISDGADDTSLSGSYTSAAEHSSVVYRNAPIDIEVLQGGEESDLSAVSERRVQVLASDVSSMPPDSMLEEVQERKATPKRVRSRGDSVDGVVIDTLKTPSRRRSRSLSKERLAHKVMEKIAVDKLASKSREASSGKQKRSSKNRSRSVSNEDLVTGVEKSRRRSSRRQQEESDLTRGDDSSNLTTSALSPRRQSGDQYSFRSGTSKSSINANPKLLETVENAIRRLIMPELETLKQEQKMQKSRSKFEQDSVTSTSNTSRGDISRKLSKHASAPDVSGKPKVVLNRDEHNAGTVLSGDSVKGRKEHRRARKSDSPSERSFERDMSEETVIRDGEKGSRKRSGHRLRDATAGALAGGILTAAALKNHEHRHEVSHSDSRSSIDRKERRRRRSKSHSRSASIAETDEIFHKHDVPPMPMRSDIQSSDITRDSILSERTEEPTTPNRNKRFAEVHNVSRGSPREESSPISRNVKRSPRMQKSLDVFEGNHSQGELSPRGERSPEREHHHSKGAKLAALGAAAGAGALAARELSGRRQTTNNEYEYDSPNRGLSPIQSVSSRQESEHERRDSLRHQESDDSIAAIKRQNRANYTASIPSVSSAADITFDHRNRPKGMNLESPEDVLDQHRLHEPEYVEGDDREMTEKDEGLEEWYQKEHEKNDRYRDSLGEDAMVDYKRMTNSTNDSMAAREVQSRGVGRNPDFRASPDHPESAVASILDASIVSARSKNTEAGYPSDPDAISRDEMAKEAMRESGYGQSEDGDLEKRISERSLGRDRQAEQGSLRESIARSVDDAPVLGFSSLPVAEDPLPDFGHTRNSEDEISTNPSDIRGPKGGAQPESHDGWEYEPTPTQPKFVTQSKDMSASDTLKAAAAGFLAGGALAGANMANSVGDDHRINQQVSRELSIKDGFKHQEEDDYGVNHDFGPTNRDSYITNPPIPSPPKDWSPHKGWKDEGYHSGPGPHPTIESPELAFKDAKNWNDGDVRGLDAVDDPFVGKTSNHMRHLSTNSGIAHGGSPLYDSSTGEGLDRIASKDIVALMDHLTVRDAQRNVRDTEILVTLVRSAAEMRNSFEEMKKFISSQDDVRAEHNSKEHDRTIQKLSIGGPRPQPGSRQASAEDVGDDSAAKKRSIFRRALKGLGGRNQNDINRIEDMLERLLNEVQELKTGDVRTSVPATRTDSVDSNRNIRASASNGLEAEGPAEVGSTGQGNYYSNSPRGPSAMDYLRHSSQNRVSTVLEADEEGDADERDLYDDGSRTPTREHPRAGSVPLGTPPQQTRLPTGTQSNEHTPKTSSDRTGKHKSNSSSFIPKFSRWSKTTASSTGDNARYSNGRRERPSSEASRSGELQQYDTGHYSPAGDDRLRSHDSFVNDPAVTAKDQREDDDDLDDNRPPSPLIPSEVSGKSENPKYQAVRNSINLQHPQPRQGPTHRYQTHLESQAQHYNGSHSPISPTSDSFGQHPALARYMPAAGGQRYSINAGTMSPVMSEDGYNSSRSATGEPAPPRPPKIKADDDDNGPLIPPSSSPTLSTGPSRPPKLTGKDNRPTFASPLSTEHLQPASQQQQQRYSDASYESASNAKNDSPRSSSNIRPPQRKPTGPRPITTSGSYSPDKEPTVRRTRYRGSPNPIDSPTQSDDQTF